MLLHRKNDSRDARSMSEIRYGVPGSIRSGWRSTRSRNSGETSSASSAHLMPASKPPSSYPAAYDSSNGSTSAPVTGRRKARRVRFDRISRAHGSSSAGRSGLHTKMACRLRASPSASGTSPSYGPTTWMLNTIGLIGTREYWKLATGGFGGRASYAMLRSSEPMNDALTRRVPAFTGMRTSSRPPTPAPDPARLYSSVSKSNSLTRPWSSRNSSLCPVPATGWLRGRSRLMRNTYSPSSGKWCRTAMPPREPNGRSSFMRPSCSRSGDVLYIVAPGRSVGSPTARRLTLAAADM